MLGTGSGKTKHAVGPHTSLLTPFSLPQFALLVPSSHSLLQLPFHQYQGTMAVGYWTRCKHWSKTCVLKVSQPLIPWMTVCLKSSSRSRGKKQSMRSQVISQRSEYPVRESALWNIPAVSITSSIFFKDSGMASSYNQRQDTEWTDSNEQKLKTADGLPWKQAKVRNHGIKWFGKEEKVKKPQKPTPNENTFQV